jgi:hypothetical protein
MADTLLGIRLLVADSRRSVSLGTVIYFPFHILRLQRSKILVASILDLLDKKFFMMLSSVY